MGEASVDTGAGVPLGAISFVAGRGDCDEKTVTLKIENFAEFLEMSNQQLSTNGMTFEAGNFPQSDGTRTAAAWKYYFKHTKEDDEDCFGGYLSLLKSDKLPVKNVKASYSVQLSSGNTEIASLELPESKEFSKKNNSGWGWDRLATKAEILEKTRATDRLEVTLNVKVFSCQGFKPLLQAVPSSPTLIELRGKLTADFGRLLDSGDGEVEVKVPKEIGGEVDEASYARKVHKNILMARSSVFATMFGEESAMVEAQTGKVVISDLSPKGLDIFVHYLYTGEVLPDWTQVFEEVINAAEKYDCGKLKQYCGHNLLPVVTISNARKMYKFAKLHSLSFAAKGVMEFIQKNTKAVVDQDADAGPDNDEDENESE